MPHHKTVLRNKIETTKNRKRKVIYYMKQSSTETITKYVLKTQWKICAQLSIKTNW